MRISFFVLATAIAVSVATRATAAEGDPRSDCAQRGWSGTTYDAECVLDSYDELEVAYDALDTKYKNLKNLYDELKKKEGSLPYLALFSISHVCEVFHELKIGGMTQAERNNCFRYGEFAPARMIALMKAAQKKLAATEDGWLRTDQFVRLVCEGVDDKTNAGRSVDTPATRRPASERYAGWMLATGQGLPRNPKVARVLLASAKASLEKVREELLREKNADAISVREAGRFIDQIDKSVPYVGPLSEVSNAQIYAACTGEAKRTVDRADPMRRIYIGPDAEIAATDRIIDGMDVPVSAAIAPSNEEATR